MIYLYLILTVLMLASAAADYAEERYVWATTALFLAGYSAWRVFELLQ